MKHTDIAGQELAVGDRVAIAITGYRTFQLGTIVRFTPKGMQVQTGTNRFNHEPELTFRAREMVAKVPA